MPARLLARLALLPLATIVLGSPRAAAADEPSRKDATAEAAGDAPRAKVKKHKPKRTAKRKASAKEVAKPCVGPVIAIDRTGREAQELRLVDCHRAPVEGSRLALSVLARPWGAPKPEHLATAGASAAPRKGRANNEIAAGVRLLDPGLLKRLDAITRKFQHRPLSIVSGYRPQSQGSQHQVGRALDLRVVGVSNEELVAFCKTLPDTGCGYYPNSSFVHVDVRNRGTGTVSWIDASGPGEGPRYVTRWPPPKDDERHPLAPSLPGAIDPWDELGRALPDLDDTVLPK